MPRARSLLCCSALITCIFTGATLAQPETHEYAQINGVPIHLDLRLPESSQPTPLIIWIHGGGWATGTRTFPNILQQFFDDGYALATIDYRLTTQSASWNGAPVTWPAQAHDCKAAVRFLRANAEAFNLDPCAFISWGSSAGGHLSAVLGTSNNDPFLEGQVGEHGAVSSDVQLAVDYFGPTDLLLMNLDVTDPPGSMIDHDAITSPESMLLGAQETGISVGEIRAHIGDPNSPWPALVSLARSAAPARHAQHAPSNVPMFIAHGQQDTSVPHGQSERLHAALLASGGSSELRSVPDAGHGMPPEIAEEVKLWLDAQVAALPSCVCVADLAPPFGSLDFSDVSAFLLAFSTQSPEADLAFPSGVFNFSDVVAFLSAFGEGCP